MLLEARDLHKSYDSRSAVADVSLSAGEGEIVGLLGPNGAGKTTTVAMLCGLLTPDRGEVRVGGHVIEGDASRVKCRIGLVPQDIALYEDRPALSNLELFGALYGIGGALLEERCSDALALVGLSDRARDKPQSFSGGMKRRLNIACALIHDPDLLLLDEPTVGVDPQSRNAIFDNLEALRRRGKALVYTTHYMEEAERLCDRVAIVDHGKVIALGTPAELIRQLGGENIIDFHLAEGMPVPAEEELARLESVRSARRDGEAYSLAVDQPHLALPALLGHLQSRGLVMANLTTRHATLEDVFVSLTGRHLREDNNGSK
jgi:ABC-2 type transport system ATP-binding protein